MKDSPAPSRIPALPSKTNWQLNHLQHRNSSGQSVLGWAGRISLPWSRFSLCFRSSYQRPTTQCEGASCFLLRVLCYMYWYVICIYWGKLWWIREYIYIDMFLKFWYTIYIYIYLHYFAFLFIYLSIHMIHFYDKYQMVIFLAFFQHPFSHQEWRSYQLEIGCQPLHLTCLACGHQVQFFTWIPSRELLYQRAGTFESMIFLFPRWNMLVSRRVMVWFVDFLIEILRHVRVWLFLQKARHDRCFYKDKGKGWSINNGDSPCGMIFIPVIHVL